ncbi:AraC family transcriptional regulator [Kordiimonas aquimaris]|uniref:AraC family transcriptional regulator n=1 Tax=Kordiimonas aquimaris TaxID=707591 RepID=UPI00374D3BD8
MNIRSTLRAKENCIIKGAGNLDRIEAMLQGRAYAPHRHDTYAIGLTLSGVQSFDYCGETRHSISGQMVVLHPDELHDGRAGTDEGFRYKTVYIKPSDIQDVLGGKPLPFIAGGVSTDIRLSNALSPLLEDYDQALSTFQYQDALYDLAVTLDAISSRSTVPGNVNYDAVKLAQECIDDNLDENLSLDNLEQVADYDRWQLSRDFRALLGTSPYRYLILRRLDKARTLLLDGSSIVDVATLCGFADQSHFGRQFKKAYGLPPKSWLRTVTL